MRELFFAQSPAKALVGPADGGPHAVADDLVTEARGEMLEPLPDLLRQLAEEPALQSVDPLFLPAQLLEVVSPLDLPELLPEFLDLSRRGASPGVPRSLPA